MSLTEKQLEFLLEFFELPEYPGWKNVATCLLTEGNCIVPGTKCIWKGGVGNYIKTESLPNAYNCILYKFDLYMFLSSPWIKEHYEYHIAELEETIKRLEDTKNEIKSLYK
jgi:hypothetical protein